VVHIWPNLAKFIVREQETMEKLTEEKGKTMEIDFKYFYALIFDYQRLRTILILNKRSSERLKEKLYALAEKISIHFSKELEEFYGNMTPFKEGIPDILNEVLELYYKDYFVLIDEKTRFQKIKELRELSSLENRVLHVIESYLREHDDFKLDIIFDLMADKNEDLIIEAMENLINLGIIVPKKE